MVCHYECNSDTELVVLVPIQDGFLGLLGVRDQPHHDADNMDDGGVTNWRRVCRRAPPRLDAGGRNGGRRDDPQATDGRGPVTDAVLGRGRLEEERDQLAHQLPLEPMADVRDGGVGPAAGGGRPTLREADLDSHNGAEQDLRAAHETANEKVADLLH